MPTVLETLHVDEAKMNAFMAHALEDLGAAMNAGLVLIGDKLGLYKAMAGKGAMTAAELAASTGTDARYVLEWLSAQAAGGYVTYNPAARTFTLPDEQALALAMEDGPAFIPGAYQVISAAIKDEPRIEAVFRNGQGVGWHEHDASLFQGTERFFRTNYAAHLVSEWIPALAGVQEKLRRGARIADVGCGHGASSILLAKAYPKCRIMGFDYHEPSIRMAREKARKEGVADRVTFEVAMAKAFPGEGFDLVAMFDCLHDMGDPVGAARHVRESLDPGGTWMIVEPFAGDHLEENLNPVGRVFYGASTLICTPASKSQEVGLALGAQAGEAKLRDVVLAGGFTQFRRATETPFNLIFEAKR